ncbi:MAG: Thiosulfate sulfurtransferase GlpE [Paracidovorax wautersii]|uniref:Thiosulfate sulfurtransferase GlpE n=1 Tax=Paracidovorax wautersii TaxID=1177982 RepID=A0A7V8FNF6_9BURK|nr:MAG: Thiosulfate sulfurtransferase GlpE [Paracidovorax wautersii]
MPNAATLTPTAAPLLSATDLKAALDARDEIALLDVRETGQYARQHLLYAVSLPLWRIGWLVDRLVPRRDTRIVLTDLDGSLVQEAAARLAGLGYVDVSALAGGTLAWAAAGYEVFSGTNVPSKAFGEVVEREAQTPHIDVRTLREKIQRGDKVVIVDGRTPQEFRNFSLPGAHSIPNAELPYRVRELAPDPGTLVVVNCAGRTRSIIGAQTLIDAGLPNPVAALQDGTMAWLLEGHALEHGRAPLQPEPSPAHLARAREDAQALARRAGVVRIEARELAAFAADTTRTLYRFDVRSAEEYRAGHLPDWRWAPGGQLVQATDEYVGTRGARVVLADWDGVRALVTAAWLAQLGLHEVFVFSPGPSADAELETGDERVRILREPGTPLAPWIGVRQAQELADAGQARIFDIDKNPLFARRHIAQAAFSAPDSLPRWLDALPGGTVAVITSTDGALAQLVASELLRRGYDVRALAGGSQAWFDAGLPTGSGREAILTGEDDARADSYAYDDPAVRNRKFREYLDWEVGLLAQIERPGGETPFRVAGRPGHAAPAR